MLDFLAQSCKVLLITFYFLRAINTDFDRIIAMCKNWQVNVSSELMIDVLDAFCVSLIRFFMVQN